MNKDNLIYQTIYDFIFNFAKEFTIKFSNDSHDQLKKREFKIKEINFSNKNWKKNNSKPIIGYIYMDKITPEIDMQVEKQVIPINYNKGEIELFNLQKLDTDENLKKEFQEFADKLINIKYPLLDYNKLSNKEKINILKQHPQKIENVLTDAQKQLKLPVVLLINQLSDNQIKQVIEEVIKEKKVTFDKLSPHEQMQFKQFYLKNKTIHKNNIKNKDSILPKNAPEDKEEPVKPSSINSLAIEIASSFTYALINNLIEFLQNDYKNYIIEEFKKSSSSLGLNNNSGGNNPTRP